MQAELAEVTENTITATTEAGTGLMISNAIRILSVSRNQRP